MSGATQVSMDSQNSSLVARILNEHLRQFQLTGLITAMYGTCDTAARRMHLFYHMMVRLLEASPDLARAPLTLKTPAVYSVDYWDSPQLAGYVGEGLQITPRGFMASYLNLWSIAVKDPETTILHFVKCALWYYENHERNLSRTLKLMVDLYGHGFFGRPVLFTDTICRFARIYSSGADLSFLQRTTHRDLSQVNAELGRIASRSPPVASESLELIVDGIIDLTHSLINEVREAASADEWLLGHARLYGPALFCAVAHGWSDKYGFSGVTRAMLSSIEEITADLHSVAFLLNHRWLSRSLEPRWDYSPNPQLVEEYRSALPEDEWLERLSQDRLLMPDKLLEIVRFSAIHGVDAALIPDEFQRNSPKLATPICIACDRDPNLIRAIDFPSGTLAILMNDDTEKGVAPDISRARGRLIAHEIGELVDAVNASAGHGDRSVAEFLSRYPWNTVPVFYSALAGAGSGDRESSAQALMLALLSSPHDVRVWRALADLELRNGNAADADVLRSAASAIHAIIGGTS